MSMLNRTLPALAAAMLLGLPAFAQEPPRLDPAGFATGRVIALPRAGLSDEALGKALRGEGGRAGRRIGRSGLVIVDVPAGGEAAVVERLRRHPNFKNAELDRRLPPTFAVTDPYAGSEWHLGKIGVPSAWDSAQGTGVTIAILDSGVDGTHPDLAPRLLPGWNFYDNNADTSDVMGHGTNVAGTAAAAMNNGIGVAGVAGQARLLPVRISDPTGYGYFSTIAQGLVWAADQGAKVANISYGVTGSSAVISAAQYMKSKGGLVFVAAGNSGTELTTPDTTAMVTVSATTSTDVRASWSSFGNFVTLSAPGAGIYTTGRGGGYGGVSGTSFASPVAAGVAALVMSAYPGITNTQVEKLLTTTAVDLGAAGRDKEYGWGRVDAAAAVQGALALKASTVDTQKPSAAIASPAGGAVVSGLVNVDVSASDNVGVTRVELRVDGNVVASDASQPFGFAWDSSSVANGAATLTVTAYDAAGNAATSAGTPVTVNNVTVAVAPPDTTPPTVGFSSPRVGALVQGNLTVSTVASDDRGTTGLTQTLYIDGAKVTTASGAKLYYSWNTKKVAAGAHTLLVVAKDAAGNTATSTVTVKK